MEKRKIYLPAIMAVMAIVTVFAIGSVVATTGTTTATAAGFQNQVTVTVCHPDGSCESQTVKNNVTTNGLNHTRNLLSQLGDVANQNWTFVELSTDATGASVDDDACPSAVTGNGLDIKLSDSVRHEPGSGNFTSEAVFAVTGTQNSIAKVCLGNSSTTSDTGGLMAQALLSNTVNVQNGDTLNITYSVAAVNA